MRARNYICSLSWEGIYDLTFQQGLKVIFKTRQGKVVGKVSSVALWAFRSPALPSSGEATLGHAVLFMCFKSTIVVIFWKGQAAVEVILTLFPPFPPPSPVVNKWACVHPQHHPSHLYYWIRINGHPPTSTVDFFPLISIPCMSLHSLPQNKSHSWMWQCCCDERSIDFWMVAVWLLHTGESSFLLAGGTRARLILIALLYSER